MGRGGSLPTSSSRPVCLVIGMWLLLLLASHLPATTPQGTQYQGVNSDCFGENGVAGTCRQPEHCPAIQAGIQRRANLKVCRGNDPKRPLVCCPFLPVPANPRLQVKAPLPGVGEVCREEGSLIWHCREQQDCPGVEPAEMNGWAPRRCGTPSGRQLVCCPPGQRQLATKPPATNDWSTDLDSSSGSVSPVRSPQYWKAERLCLEYSKFVNMTVRRPIHVLWEEEEGDMFQQTFCGREVTPLITNGSDAFPREFPHMAQIGYGYKVAIEWRCGGSLISERFILSAAHCTQPKSLGFASWAKLGELDTSTDKDDAQPVVVQIVERLNHPGYKVDGELYHDIALYKLAENVKLGIYIRPICLNTDVRVTARKALASGWGHTFWKSNSGTSMLQKVELRVVPNEVCRSYYSPKSYQALLPLGVHADYMICAGGHEGKDTCQGDSGGPLQEVRDEPYCTYNLIGITSFGSGCGTSTPGVYTNVAHYASWIQGIVWPT